MRPITARKKKLADIVVDELKHMIIEGELKEGDKLPNQNELAAALGVSRPSLREALNTLTFMGVIEQTPGRGTILKSGNPELWNESLTAPLLSDHVATVELIEARKDLEAIVIRHAVDRITDGEIAEIRSIVKKMKTTLENGDIVAYQKLDLLFHNQLATASHNRYFIHIFSQIRNLMEEFIKEMFTLVPSQISSSFNFHSNILEAIAVHNKNKAVSQIRAHITDIEKAVRIYYSKQKK